MMKTGIARELKSRTALRPRVVGRIRVGRLLSVSEPEFARLIQELESDPVFSVLSQARRGGVRLLSYSPVPQASLSPRFYEEFHGESSASGESFDVDELLER